MGSSGDGAKKAVAIRAAAEADMAAVRAIYAHHVLHGLASFEEEAPSVIEMKARREDILARGFPYLVAESAGEILGYSYASQFRTRPAYRYTAEDSVYVREDAHGRGIGASLLRELIRLCEAGPSRQMLAIIGDSGNVASIALHRRFGFEMIGTCKSVGFKLGHWVDTVYMQRTLGQGDSSPPTA
jgi:L-amino acid N-acyltransferase YncA